MKAVLYQIMWQVHMKTELQHTWFFNVNLWSVGIRHEKVRPTDVADDSGNGTWSNG